MDDGTFRKDSNDFKNELIREAQRLSDEIDKLKRSTDARTAYYAYLKDFLINSGSLCDDILQAVNNEVTLLATVGTRVLLEDAINVHYLESKTNRMAVAEDWFRLSNDPKAYKNKLDNKSVAERAKMAGKETLALHNGEYVDFCNYTHSTAQRSVLNSPVQRRLIGKKSALASLKAYANIVSCVARIIGEQTPGNVVTAANNYFENYRKSVIEASLPPLVV